MRDLLQPRDKNLDSCSHQGDAFDLARIALSPSQNAYTSQNRNVIMEDQEDLSTIMQHFIGLERFHRASLVLVESF